MKKNRHEKIRELINDNVIETQDELLRLLRKDGFDVTQATVSRDIKQLRVIKALDSNEVYRYMIPKGESATLKANYSDVFKSAVNKGGLCPQRRGYKMPYGNGQRRLHGA